MVVLHVQLGVLVPEEIAAPLEVVVVPLHHHQRFSVGEVLSIEDTVRAAVDSPKHVDVNVVDLAVVVISELYLNWGSKIVLVMLQ